MNRRFYLACLAAVLAAALVSTMADADEAAMRRGIALRREGKDLEALAEMRRLWPMYRDRRPDAYGPICRR